METLKRDCVKELLIINHLPEYWLMNILYETYGIDITKSEMTRILNGELDTPKANKVLDNALKVLRSYGKWADSLFDN